MLIIWKCAVLLVLVTLALVLPSEAFDLARYLSAFRHWPISGGPSFESRLATWDAPHYLYLAGQGYVEDSPSNAFYPLFPALIQVVSLFFDGNLIVSGLVVSNFCSLLALRLFYKELVVRFDDSLAQITIICILTYPCSVFFSLIYSEALFFLVLMLIIRSLRTKNFTLLITGCFLAPLARPVAIFCIPALAAATAREKSWRRCILALAAMIAGFGVYLMVLWHGTGNPFAGFDAQQYYPTQPKLGRIIEPVRFVKNFFSIHAFHDQRFSLLDRILFVVFLLSLWPIWKLDKVWFLFSIGLGLIPAIMGSFMSFSRFMLMVFPFFIVIAKYLKSLSHLERWVMFGGSAAIQLWALVRQICFQWVG